MNNPNFLCLHSWPATAHWWFLWPYSGPASADPCPPCTRHCRAGCSTLGGVSPHWSREAQSPSWTFWLRSWWCNPRYNWLSGLQGHIARLCTASHPLAPPNPSCQGCSQFFHLPACIEIGGCPIPGATPCTSSWDSHTSTSWACLGPSGWHLVLQACQLHHTAWCHLQICWGCIWSHCLCHWQRYWTLLVHLTHMFYRAECPSVLQNLIWRSSEMGTGYLTTIFLFSSLFQYLSDL